ncbi:MAG: hypothetical protein GMKNLPBB_00664 [Myxococcota bacterium]|nr:hypothetical protein [Myxococcota bacterium]
MLERPCIPGSRKLALAAAFASPLSWLAAGMAGGAITQPPFIHGGGSVLAVLAVCAALALLLPRGWMAAAALLLTGWAAGDALVFAREESIARQQHLLAEQGERFFLHACAVVRRIKTFGAGGAGMDQADVAIPGGVSVLIRRHERNPRPGPVRRVSLPEELAWRQPAPAKLGLSPGDMVCGPFRLAAPEPALNPGNGDGRLSLLARGMAWRGARRGWEEWRIHRRAISGGWMIWLRNLDESRRGFQRRLDETPGGGVLAALTLGDMGRLDALERESYAATGLIHLLSVSGMHITLLHGGVVWLLRFLIALALRGRRAAGDPAALAMLLSLAALPVWQLAAGGGAPIQRAVVQALCLTLVRGHRGASLSIHGLALAAVVEMLVHPHAARTASFQLSYAATLILLTAGRDISAACAGLGLRHLVFGRIAGGAAAPCAITVLLAPLVLLHTGRSPLAGALFAAPAGLLCGAALVPSWLAFALDGLAPQGSGVLLHAASFFVFAMQSLIDLAGSGGMAMDAAALAAAGTAISAVAWKAWKSHPAAVGMLSLPALAALLLAVGGLRPPPVLEIFHLAVGQGDAAVLRFGNGEVWMIDAGGSPGAGPYHVLPFLRHAGVKRLDRIWITHADRDHWESLEAIADALPIGAVHVNRSSLEHHPLRRVLGGIQRAGGRIETVDQAQWRVMAGPVRALVLNLDAIGTRGAKPPDNDRGLVLRLDWGSRCALFSGDASARAEWLWTRVFSRPCEHWLVSHHGSRHGASPRTLEIVRPRRAVISAGRDNPYGHPHPAVLRRLRRIGAYIHLTHRDGMAPVVW